MKTIFLGAGIAGLVLLLSFPLLVAESENNISLQGGRWHEFTIGVMVPSGPSSCRDLILEAMDTWNNAQSWFLQAYAKDQQQRYRLAESAGGPVEIKLVDFTGVTAIREAKPSVIDGRFVNATMLLPLSFRGYPVAAEWFEAFALHEFGHVLGLGHTDRTTDLMSESLIIGALPSTLDLFAVSILVSGATPSEATLPMAIPYVQVPTTAIPEFPTRSLALIVVVQVLSIQLIVYLELRNRREPQSMVKT